MKTLFALILSFALIAQVGAQSGVKVPPELLEIIADPPTISEAPNPMKRASFNVPKDSGAILQGDDFISFVSLQDQQGTDSVKYTFRTYSKQFNLEISGDGELYEHYYKISDPHSSSCDSRVIDRGSKLTIDAGLFKAQWSSQRYIYYDPDRFSIVAATLDDYKNQIK